MKQHISIILLMSAILLFSNCSPKTQAKQTVMKQETGIMDFRSSPPKAGPAPKVEMGEYETFTLDNGLQVIVVQNSKLPRVSFQLLFDAPPVLQGESAGYKDIAGELISRGTSKRTKAEIDQAVDFLGASFNTSADGIFASSLSRYKEDLLQIMSEVLLEPTFPNTEFQKIKTQTISGLAAGKDDPDNIASNVGKVLRYGKDHPYGELVTEESLQKITIEQCKAYYDQFFRPNISYLAIVGDIDIEEARKLSEKYLGSWKKKEVVTERVKMPAFPVNTTVDFVDKPGAVQSVINLTYPVEFKPTAKDRIAVSLMNAHFGGYFSSRINLNLREDKGFTYGARSSLNFDKYVGSFSAGASVGTKVTESAIEEVLKEMQKIRIDPLTDEEFTLVKSVMAGQFARSLEQPQSIANYALSTARYGLPADFYTSYLENLDKVTKEDIQLAAMNYIRPENTRIVVVGNKKEIAEDLARFAHNKSVDFYDFYGNKLESDQMKVPADLTADKVINDYLEAVGGLKKVESINSLIQIGEASLGGFQIRMESRHLNPDKMAISITAQGQELNSVIVNGTKAKVVNMGQPQIMEGDEAADVIAQAVIFNELKFFDDNVKMSISGIEIVEGKKAYAIEVSRNQELPEVYYYDVETKLRLRSITYNKSADQVLTQTVDYANYKDVDGIKWPHQSKISGGGMPMALTVEVKEVKFNAEIDPSVFAIK